MVIFLILLIFSIVDVITPTAYTCDHSVACGCSKSTTVVLSKIIGGEPVNIPYSWGWIASLRRDDSHQCGATLITPLHVITAAHCVSDITTLSRLSLNFGITNLSNIGELRNVAKIDVHPNYDPALHANDLAILRLQKPIDLSNSDVSYICLPTSSDFNLEQAEYPPVGDDLVAIGWGTVDPFVRIPSPILRQVTVEAIAQTDSACQNTINNGTLQFCAGLPDGGKDTCQGDSGGPLMLFKHERWQLVGITSYGELCGAPGLPGVYTRVAYYISFIQDIINSDNIYLSDGKQIYADNKPFSNTETLYQKSILQFFYIFIFIVYKKFFSCH